MLKLEKVTFVSLSCSIMSMFALRLSKFEVLKF